MPPWSRLGKEVVAERLAEAQAITLEAERGRRLGRSLANSRIA